MRLALGIAFMTSTTGCTSGDLSTSSTSSDITAWNKLASNKLASNKLASNKLASNKLASNKLSVNPLGAGDLLSTSDGRDVFSYIASCALPDGVTVEANVPGAPDVDPNTNPYSCTNGVCDFPGALGLAPTWIHHALTDSGKRWISACLFARVNAHDTAEEISLRGRAHVLTISADEQALYTVEEGAFYGNLFTPDGEPIEWFACEGEGQASGEFGGLVDRDCTEPDPGHPGLTQCGFTYAGFCRDYTPQFPSPYACRSFESAPDHGTFYDGCFGAPLIGTHHHLTDGHDHEDDDDADDASHEVITTYVTP
jgi:hypothetical protein